MNKARELIKKIQEFIPLSHYGNFTASDIEDAFKTKLSSLGYDTIGVEVIIDLDEGPLVTFFDQEGDEGTILFYLCDERGPVCSVVSEDDEQIEIELSPFNPPILTVNNSEFIDLVNLSWMNKSLLKTLLLAGEVDEKTEAQKSMVSFGGKKRKFPIVIRKDKMSDKDKNILTRAKFTGKKGNTNKKFSNKIRRK
jgi:hypothetical protein